MNTVVEQIPAGRFKQHCLSIIDQVARTHRPVVISKRGKPMARLVPVEADEEIERRILAIPRLEPVPLLVELALAADERDMHADPADRFIVATALSRQCPLITNDELLRGIPWLRTVWQEVRLCAAGGASPAARPEAAQGTAACSAAASRSAR